MDIFPPLTGFYDAIAADTRISASHISIYMALLQQWNVNVGNNPVKIERALIMKAAKINARQTYNKCINQLQEYGHIVYEPCSNQFEASVIHLKNIEMKT
ncbi:MAG TPA: hypothetical protein DCO78_14265 [Chitinophagaceae bacterium]|nr:hypothetical protein [Chitinophagaceae bacterium]